MQFSALFSFTKSLPIMAALTFSPLAVSAETLSEGRVKELALEAIMENPNIIMEAVALLQQQEAANAETEAVAALSAQRLRLEKDPNAPIIGNPEGDVTIIEFFDYNCGYCRRAGEAVQAIVNSDPNVRIVMREWPILGEASVYAAKAALASRAQGQYEAFHFAMMTAPGRMQPNRVDQIAKEIGLNMDQLKIDMESPAVAEHINASMELAQSLGFNGTPAFVIGEMIAPGFIPLADMEQAIAQSRAAQ